AWLDHVDIPRANIHPMLTDAEEPAIAAASYEQNIQGFFGVGTPPVFDLILLGIGDDGHTASLFPHTAALTVSDRWVTVGKKDDQPRLTLTYPLINQARQILFLVDGESKAPAVAAILGAEPVDLQQYPARGINPGATWLVSESAAALLQ
ncbi:MAG: 6-phosphogluconolactonase, partial [Pseudanabaenaceae cyanobacterium bins.68]|nr:6-phosphogluconolactonase [Pseudanabaenaceae cyanobacterium bins.68]